MYPNGQGKKMVIIGAGPVGALAAVYASRRGYQVEVYELRDGESSSITFSLELYPFDWMILVLNRFFSNIFRPPARGLPIELFQMLCYSRRQVRFLESLDIYVKTRAIRSYPTHRGSFKFHKVDQSYPFGTWYTGLGP